mmetsp:Transcript_30413/g.40450  ORF Transcript_30413/g.40450 Transcript_30413/m.40450 type:complete len:113 (+) Transcript_30413:3184-3522(+)
MTLFNLQMILSKIELSELNLFFDFTLSKSQLATFESLITDYEDNGDIIEPVYAVMDRLLSLGSSDHPTVKVIDHSKILLRQAVKHSAVYQCPQSYAFLKQLIAVSSRFKNKG